jgi:hypothetical protein
MNADTRRLPTVCCAGLRRAARPARVGQWRSNRGSSGARAGTKLQCSGPSIRVQRRAGTHRVFELLPLEVGEHLQKPPSPAARQRAPRQMYVQRLAGPRLRPDEHRRDAYRTDEGSVARRRHSGCIPHCCMRPMRGDTAAPRRWAHFSGACCACGGGSATITRMNTDAMRIGQMKGQWQGAATAAAFHTAACALCAATPPHRAVGRTSVVHAVLVEVDQPPLPSTHLNFWNHREETCSRWF